jgi:hypothetical protein
MTQRLAGAKSAQPDEAPRVAGRPCLVGWVLCEVRMTAPSLRAPTAGSSSLVVSSA